MTVLFNSKKSGDVTSDQLLEKLKKIGASDCDILYIHSNLNFGLPSLKRSFLLEEMYSSIEKLGVRTIVFPTFTFSFCNKEEYDIKNSFSKMGALNEYVRKNVDGVRSSDPLLSVFVIGDELNLIDNLSKESIGKNSNYDRLHNSGKSVNFLFIGADMRECFTYTHYMETVAKVPYRYNREFVGTIIDENGIRHENETRLLFSTYGNCRLNPVPVVHDTMNELKMLSESDFGDGHLCCFKEIDAYKVMLDLFDKDINFLTDGTFDLSKKNTVYNPNNEKIVSVK